MEQQEYKYPHDIRGFLKHKDEYIQRLYNERNGCNRVFDGDDYFFSVHQDCIECWLMLNGDVERLWSVTYKQKKPYTPPTTEVTETKPEEPIACSYYEEHSGKPGHGWGDKNHDHIGPPGQNKKHGITDIWEDL